MSLHLLFIEKGLNISYPFARVLVISGLITYFLISAYVMNRWFSSIIVKNPVIIKINNWHEKIRSNPWLAAVCFISFVLHIPSLLSVEIGYLRQGLWLYDKSNLYWSKLFHFPIQYFFWMGVALVAIIIKKNMFSSAVNYINTEILPDKSGNIKKPLIMFCLFFLFIIYSSRFPYYNHWEALEVTRYPPLSYILYLITYYAFGVTHIAPRIVQMLFYILGAIYLYRTILLFDEKEVGILGATIYLFSPLIFSYASVTAIESGVIFFIIIISFHFLRFIKDEDSRDLILTSFFIGTGFLYKQGIVVMFAVCFAYLFFNRIKKRDWYSASHYKILLLSLVALLPWLKIGAAGVVYQTEWTYFMSFEKLSAYLSIINTQLSLIVFVLLLCSFIYVLFIKRDDLSLFFGLLFLGYYVFFTLNLGETALHRYSMALYPSIAVLLALFIGDIIQKIKWKPLFGILFPVLAGYLIFICMVPRASSDLVPFKYDDCENQNYPIREASDWISQNMGRDERIISFFVPSFNFYIERFYKDTERINKNRFIFYGSSELWDHIYPMQNLTGLCYREKAAYIMFPFSPHNSFPTPGAIREARYLEQAKNKGFIEAARFSTEDNYILIYKLEKDLIL